MMRDTATFATAKLAIVGIAALEVMTHAGRAEPKCDLLKVAEEYIAERYPRSDNYGLKLVISEDGDLWEMTYELPPWMLGGVPIITIDKRTCKVVRAKHTQ